MNGNPPPTRRVLSVRRLGLLAPTIAGLGAAAFFVAPNLTPDATFLAGPAHAQNLSQEAQKLPQRPIGFADIVAKVKPAVISVRVKIDRLGVMSSLSEDETPSFPARLRRWTGSSVASGAPNGGEGNGGHHVGHRPRLRLLHHRRRLCRDQQSRRAERRERAGHCRRRQDLFGQGHRHRSAHRSGLDQGRRARTSPT